MQRGLDVEVRAGPGRAVVDGAVSPLEGRSAASWAPILGVARAQTQPRCPAVDRLRVSVEAWRRRCRCSRSTRCCSRASVCRSRSSRTATAPWCTTCCAWTPTSGTSGRSASARATRWASTGRSRCSGSAAGSKMTDVEAHADGTFSLVAVGMDRIALEHLDVTGAYPVGRVVERPEAAASRRPPGGRAGAGHVRRLPRRAGGVPRRPVPARAARRIPRTSPGRWPPSRRCPSTSGRRCSRPRTPASGCGWSLSCYAPSCAR